MIFFKVALCLCERLHLDTSFCLHQHGLMVESESRNHCSCSFCKFTNQLICWICGVVQLSLWSSWHVSSTLKSPWAHLQYFSTAKRIPVREAYIDLLSVSIKVTCFRHFISNETTICSLWCLLLSFSVMLWVYVCHNISVFHPFYLLNSLLYGYVPHFIMLSNIWWILGLFCLWPL